MKLDPLKQFVQLRNKLAEEKTRLEARLKEINRALGGEIPTPFRAEKPAARKRAVKRIKNPISLRQSVIKLTKEKPLTKPEILAGLKKLGYKTTSKKPINLLNSVLYGKNPKFKNQGGTFSPA